jgi:hypothetical protein
MNKITLIYQHMGLGDHIICNGLVRNLIKNDKNYKMFVFDKYYESVSFMYRDLINLEYIKVTSDWDAHNFINQNRDLEVIKIGTTIEFFEGPFHNQFDEMFYQQHRVDFKKRWDDFKIIRDLNREMALFQKYELNDVDYVFIHDDQSRGLYLREENLNINYRKVVRPDINFTNNIFDYIHIMENANECHFIDSSFKVLFDSVSNRNSNIFHHLLLKHGHRSKSHSNSKLNFKIYK